MITRLIRNCTAAAALLSAVSLSATETETQHAFTDTTHYDLDPVVVTGTGIHQRLKLTSVPVEVITGNELRNAGLTDLQEALTMMVPTLSFSPTAMGSYLRMNSLTNSHVLILLNGRKMTDRGNVSIAACSTRAHSPPITVVRGGGIASMPILTAACNPRPIIPATMMATHPAMASGTSPPATLSIASDISH